MKEIIKTELEKTVDISKAQETVNRLMNKNKKAVLTLQKNVDSEKKKKLTEYIKLTKYEITEDEFVKNRVEIDKRIEVLNEKFQSITYQKISEEDITVLNLFSKYIGVDNIDNDIIRDLVKAIYVYNEKRIEVVWTKTLTYLLTQRFMPKNMSNSRTDMQRRKISLIKRKRKLQTEIRGKI